MNLFDRDRLIIAAVVSLLVHGAIFAGISIADFNTQVPEFSGPVYVDLPPVVDTPVPADEEETVDEQSEERQDPERREVPEETTEADAPPEPRESAVDSPEQPESATEPRSEDPPEPSEPADPPESAPVEPTPEPAAPGTTAEARPSTRTDSGGAESGAETTSRRANGSTGTDGTAGFRPPEPDAPELPEWVTNPDAAGEREERSARRSTEPRSSELPPVEQRESPDTPAQPQLSSRPDSADATRRARDAAPSTEREDDPLDRRRSEEVEVSRNEVFGREGEQAEPRSDEELPESSQGWLPREQGDTAPSAPELPDWAERTMERAGISTEEMSSEEATQLAEKLEADPELERRLESVIAAVSASRRNAAQSPGQRESRPGTDGEAPGRSAAESRSPGQADAGGSDGDAEAAQPAEDAPSTERPGDGQDRTASSTSGDSALQFLGPGTGSLRPSRGFPEDILSQEDFPGVVPAETRFVIVFEISPSGVVVPGSVIFQQQSPYTSVNEKIRRAVVNWGFTPHGADEPVTAIFTPIVRREDVRR
jgi:hypothetical protein